MIIICIIIKIKPVHGDLTNHQVLYEILRTPSPTKTYKDEMQKCQSWKPAYSLGVNPSCQSKALIWKKHRIIHYDINIKY